MDNLPEPLPEMSRVSEKAVIRSPETVVFGENVTIMEFVLIGMANYDQEIFENDEQRKVRIGNNATIYPMAVLLEGATLEEGVIIEERTSVGSRSIVGARTKILYHAQVNDFVNIGADCVVGGFVADNTTIGNGCSVFGALVHRYDNADTRAWDTTDETGPTLEDKVVIGWGAVVCGGVRIGAGARVLPNVLVTENVPPRARYDGRKR